MNTEAGSRLRSRLTLLAILGIFVVPIFVAWLYAIGILNPRARALVNEGQLLQPPIDLATLPRHLPGIAPLFEMRPSEWALFLLEPGDCEDACNHRLDALLELRERLGQGAVRVNVRALSVGPGAAPRHAMRAQTGADSFDLLRREFAARGVDLGTPRITLVDWRHQLVMHYGGDEEPSRIQKDLGRLLRASAIR
jgi:hypothetical protein